MRLRYGWLWRYGRMAGVVALAFALTALLPALRDGASFPLFFAAILISAWVDGTRPGLVATAASTVLLFAYFQPSISNFETALADFLRMSVFLLVALLIVALTTARQQAQSALEREREWLQVTLASIGDAVIVSDAEGVVTFLNPAAAALTGWTEQEAVGRPLEQVFRLAKEKTREKLSNPISRILAEGLMAGMTSHTLLTRDGREVPIDESGAPIRDANRRPIGIVLVFRDVRERKRAQEAIYRLAAIVESSEDAIIGKDLEGTITSWNPGATRLFGYAPEDVIGRPIALLLPPDRSNELPGMLSRLRRGDAIDLFETVRMRKDGKCLDVSLSVSPIRDAAGRIIGASTIARDITGRKRLEEQLRQRAEELGAASRYKDEFLAMLAHELRNPLAPIHNALHLLKAAADNPPAAQEAREVLDRQIRHLTHLVDDLLDISRITRGKILLRKERLDLAQLVQATAKDHAVAMEAAQLTLKLEVPREHPIWVKGDGTRLSQVVGNLLQNAAKFTDPGGRVTVRLGRSSSDRWAVIAVQDTGVGIEPELLPRLFEPCIQADRSLHRSRGGLGLGLALVRGLAELHGGRVQGTSPGPGHGSTFTVWLPLASEEETPPKPPADAEPIRKPLRILVIEDSPDTARTLRLLLEMAGHRVQVAHTGPAGIEAARRWQPDVVLSDLGLPEMDGFEVAATLRRDPLTARTRLIAVSGYGRDEDRRQSLAAGFDLHLTKPVDPEELQRVLAAPDLADAAAERPGGPTGGSAEFRVLVQGSQTVAKGGDKSKKGDQGDGTKSAT